MNKLKWAFLAAILVVVVCVAAQRPRTWFGITSEAQYPVDVDQTSSALMVIAFAHHELHEGDSYEVTAADESMSNNDTLIIAFRTGATKNTHMLISFQATIAGHIDLIEGPTWDTNTGTATTVHNRRRDSSNTSLIEEDKSDTPAWTAGAVLVNPTGLADGTVIDTRYALAAQAAREGGGERGTVEWVLTTSTQYAVRFTADGNSNGGFVSLNWYEHTDSN